jgi:hypothetical protein
MTEWQERGRGPITEERLVRAVNVLAEIVKQHGPAYSPLFESVEQELRKFRRLHQRDSDQMEPLVENPARRVA